MSENNTGEKSQSFFKSSGTASASSGLKWGLTAGGVTVTDWSVTWGLQGKVNYGMSAAAYFSPAALALAAVSPLVPLYCMPMVMTQSETMYKILARIAAGSYGFFGGLPTDLGKRAAQIRHKFMNFPAYVTIESGAKCDTVLGNKYDFCIGSVNKMVNGETVYCMADKVEWYDANLYKYIGGTETKMEASKLGSQVVGGKSNVTQNEVLKDKNHYSDNYTKHANYTKEVTKANAVIEAGKDIKTTCGGAYTLQAKSMKLTAAEDMNAAFGGALQLAAFDKVSLSSSSAEVSIGSGANPGLVVSAAETKISNRLTLGMPGGQAPVNVASALAQYNASLAEMNKDIEETQLHVSGLYDSVIALYE